MNRLLRGRDGSSVVEMALLMPLFLLILFGIVEGAEVLNAWMILTNETREAARYGVAGVRDGDASLVTEIQSKTTSDLSAVLRGTPTVNVSLTTAGGLTTAVSVTATYNVPLLTPFTQAAMGSSVPVTVTSTMRAE